MRGVFSHAINSDAALSDSPMGGGGRVEHASG